MSSTLREMENNDLEMVLAWRNNEHVRNNMYNNIIISIKEHKDWFNRISTDKEKKYLIYEENNVPKGVIYFMNISKEYESASWGFYSGDLSSRGIGTKMEEAALKYAFEYLNVNKLWCEVLSFNMKVVRFHQKFGFKVEGILEKHYKRDGVFYDIVRLALFKNNWKKKYLKVKDIPKKYSWNFLFTEDDIKKFSAISGDHNPIHIDDTYAIDRGFDSKIAHGAMLTAEISAIAANVYPGEGCVYLSQKIRFLSPIYPDHEIRGFARLLTHIGRYVLIEFEFKDKSNNLVATCESEFLL